MRVKFCEPIARLALVATLAVLVACTNEVEKKSDGIAPENKYDEEYFRTSADTSVTGSCENVTFSSATLTGKINNMGGIQKLPAGSTFGILLSSSTNDPQYGADGVVNLRSQRRSLVYSCEAAGLNMGTVYYYRSYFCDGRTRHVYLGRVFAFGTERCDVVTLAPSMTGFCSATVRGKSGIKLNQTSFKGSYGVLFTARQTDKPNAGVDTFVRGRVAAGDSVVFEADLTDLQPGAKYLYQAYLKIDTAYYYGSVMSLTTHQLAFSDSDIPVDLGLSVRWASRNVGAKSAELAGTYFAYGDPTGEMNTSDYTQYPNTDIATTDKDMATANLGVGWQLPTFDQFKELADWCDWLWTTYKGAQGYAVMNRDGSTCIFLPACGYSVPNKDGSGRDIVGYDMSQPQGFYWSGSKSVTARSAYSLAFSVDKVNVYNLGDKSYGFCVRPVAE